jgi:hypothetical protein
MKILSDVLVLQAAQSLRLTVKALARTCLFDDSDWRQQLYRSLDAGSVSCPENYAEPALSQSLPQLVSGNDRVTRIRIVKLLCFRA